MNHKPFEEWLRAEGQPEGEEGRLLAKHVASCETCRGLIANLRSAESLFQMAGELAPAPGFSGRWRARLSVKKARDERKQAMLVLAVNSSIAAVLFVMLAGQTLPLLASPVDLLVGFVQRVSDALLFLNVSARLLDSLSRILPGLLPASWWAALAAALAAGLFLWLRTLRQYAFQQGVRK